MNKSNEPACEVQDNVDLELLQDKLQYFQQKGDFFDGQTEAWSKLIKKQGPRVKESLKELQELIDKFNEREIEKNKLKSYLKTLKGQVEVKNCNETLGNAAEKHQKVITKINGFFNCPECPYKAAAKHVIDHHINAVHRKLRPWKCSDCNKGWLINYIELESNLLNIFALFQRFQLNLIWHLIKRTFMPRRKIGYVIVVVLVLEPSMC